jgi:hypothetical protein
MESVDVSAPLLSQQTKVIVRYPTLVISIKILENLVDCMNLVLNTKEVETILELAKAN